MMVVIVRVGVLAYGPHNLEAGIILSWGSWRREKIQGTDHKEKVLAHPLGGKSGPDVQPPRWQGQVSSAIVGPTLRGMNE